MFTDGTTTFRPDKTSTKEVEPRIRRVKFGDGYGQRLAIGTQPLDEKFMATFRTRPSSFIETLEDFLEDATEFTFTTPDQKSIIVRCISYSTIYEFGGFWTLSMEVERV